MTNTRVPRDRPRHSTTCRHVRRHERRERGDASGETAREKGADDASRARATPDDDDARERRTNERMNECARPRVDGRDDSMIRRDASRDATR